MSCIQFCRLEIKAYIQMTEQLTTVDIRNSTFELYNANPAGKYDTFLPYSHKKINHATLAGDEK